MQTRDQQSKRSKDWKVIAALTAASALGVSGLALAGSSDGPSNPDPIDLRDRTAITSVTTPSSMPTTIAQLLEASADSQLSTDSPFDDVDSVSTALVDSPASVDSPVSVDSPEQSAAEVSPASDDSPASPVSADSASADSVESTDDSADS
jgi:hypothetical protein